MMKTGILVLSVLVMLASGVKAQPMTKDNRSFKGMNMMRPDSDFRGAMRANFERQRRMNQQGLMHALGLNDEQVKAIKEIHLRMYKEVKPLQNLLNEAEAHQKTLLSADDPKLNAINDNIDKIGKLKTDIQKIRIKYLLEMKSKLTDEQRMKMDMMKMNHGNFNGHRNGSNLGGMNGHNRQGFNGPGGNNFGPGLNFKD
jgi:Spy/CpxP family protein refolding chaperone